MNRYLNLFGTLWALLVTAGIVVAFTSEVQPGATAAPPPDLSGNLKFIETPARFQLLIFSHPHCPCTRATLAELAKLLARLDGKIDAGVYFHKPGAGPDEIEASENWRLAAAIPGVVTIHDPDGSFADRFGAKVSGQTLLYSPDGHLLFSGGITAARGHEGYNPGAASIIDLVAGESVGFVQTPVFGCALADPDSIFLREQPSWSKR